MHTINEIRSYYDRVADEYDKMTATNLIMSVLDHVTRKWVKRNLPKDRASKILDAGEVQENGPSMWLVLATESRFWTYQKEC